MDPRDFQKLATRLASTTDLADLRTAVSRAYYAVFLVALEILNGMGFTIPRNYNGHGEVQKYLSNSGNIDVQGIGQKLADLHVKEFGQTIISIISM